MDERKEPKFDTSLKIRLTILSSSPGVPDKLVPASMIDISGRGLRLITEGPVPVGSAVRVDFDDNILLGEVCHLSQSGPASFTCGIHLEQALAAVNNLARLVEGIMGESRTESRQKTVQREEVPAPKERRRLSALLST